MSDDNDSRPVGFLGKLRNRKAITWVVIIALIVLTVGAGTIVAIIQFVLPGGN
jgi:hypothetical protein